MYGTRIERKEYDRSSQLLNSVYDREKHLRTARLLLFIDYISLSNFRLFIMFRIQNEDAVNICVVGGVLAIDTEVDELTMVML